MGVSLCLALLLGVARAGLPEPPAPGTVTVEEDARARELYLNGVTLYEEGRYEDAIVAWTEAWRLSGRPLLLYNIANAQERLGRYQEALDTLNRYRAYAPLDEREVLDRRMRSLERRISEAPPPAEPAVPPGRGRSVAWFGAAGLAGASAVVFGAGALLARQELVDTCVDTGSGWVCPDTLARAAGRNRWWPLAADASAVLAAGAAAAGLWTAFRPLGDAVHPWVGPGMAGVEIRLGGGT